MAHAEGLPGKCVSPGVPLLALPKKVSKEMGQGEKREGEGGTYCTSFTGINKLEEKKKSLFCDLGEACRLPSLIEKQP